MYQKAFKAAVELETNKKPLLLQYPQVTIDNQPPFTLTDGAVVIAAITSCTNTSNPNVLMAAGLLAKNAGRKKGLQRVSHGSNRH